MEQNRKSRKEHIYLGSINFPQICQEHTDWKSIICLKVVLGKLHIRVQKSHIFNSGLSLGIIKILEENREEKCTTLEWTINF
jgi:hypothetical protein